MLGTGRGEALDSVSSWCIPLRSVLCRISLASLAFACLRASCDYVNSAQVLDHSGPVCNQGGFNEIGDRNPRAALGTLGLRAMEIGQADARVKIRRTPAAPETASS